MAFYITRQIRLCCVLHSSSAFQKNPVPHSQNQSLDPEKLHPRKGEEQQYQKLKKPFVVTCYAKVTHAVLNIFCHFLLGAVVNTSLYFTPQASKSKSERKSESNMSCMERLKMAGCTVIWERRRLIPGHKLSKQGQFFKHGHSSMHW